MTATRSFVLATWTSTQYVCVCIIIYYLCIAPQSRSSLTHPFQLRGVELRGVPHRSSPQTMYLPWVKDHCADADTTSMWTVAEWCRDVNCTNLSAEFLAELVCVTSDYQAVKCIVNQVRGRQLEGLLHRVHSNSVDCGHKSLG
jgi:hypothetical protein